MAEQVALSPAEKMRQQLAQFKSPQGLQAPVTPQAPRVTEEVSVESVLEPHLMPQPQAEPSSMSADAQKTDWRQWLTLIAPLATGAGVGILSGDMNRGLAAGVSVGADAAGKEVDRRDKAQEKELERRRNFEDYINKLKLKRTESATAKPQYLEIIDENGRPRYINANEYAGQTLFDPKMLSVEKPGTIGGMKPNEIATTHGKLLQPYGEEIKNLQKASVEYRNVQEALRVGDPVAEVAAVMQFLRVVDPQSVARESEVAGILGARSKTELFGMLDDIILGKKKLTPNQARALGSMSGKFLQNRVDLFDEVSRPNIMKAGKAAGIQDFSFIPEFGLAKKSYPDLPKEPEAPKKEKYKLGPKPPSKNVIVSFQGKNLRISREDLAAAEKDGAKYIGDD